MEAARTKDSLLLLVVLAALGLEILFLLHQMRVIDLPLQWGRPRQESQPIGTVVWKSDELRQRTLGNLSWYSLGEGDPIHSDDLVMTGKNANAKLDVKGRAEINLGPDTLIQFSDVNRDARIPMISVEIQQGVAQLKSQDKAVRLELRNQKFEVSRGSEVLVSAAPLDAKTRVEVRQGDLKVIPKTGDVARTVKEGEVIEVGPERAVSSLNLPLPFVPLTPASGEAFDLREGEGFHELDFLWQGEEAEAMEVDVDRRFLQPRHFPVRDGKVHARLPAGIYFWRTRYGTRTSDPSDFKIRPSLQMEALQPLPKAVMDSSKPIGLRWKKIALASSYTVQVSNDPEFKKIVVEKQAIENGLSLKGLAVGKYFWRVRAQHPQYGNFPFSSPFLFSVKEYLAPPQPKGVELLPKKKSEWRPPLWKRFFASLWIPLAHAETAGQAVRLRFEWDPVKGAQGYVFEVSESPAFEKIHSAVEVKGTRAEVELVTERKYFWRVSAVDADGERGFPSTPVEVSPQSLVEALNQKQREEKRQREAEIAQRKKIKRDFEVSRRIAASLTEALTESIPEIYMASGGMGGSFITQNMHDSTGSTSSNGFPMGRAEIAVQKGLTTPEWEGRAWYQPYHYLSQLTEVSQPDLFVSEFGGNFLLKSPLRFWGHALYVGAQVERLAAWERVSSTEMSLENYWFAAALVGQSFYWGDSGGLHWRSDFVLNLSPLGQVRGVGLLNRNILESTDLSLRVAGISFRPRLEINLHPSLRWAGTRNNQVWTLGASAGLFLVGEFASYGPKEKGKREKKSYEEDVEDSSTVTRERRPGTGRKSEGKGLIKESYPNF